MITKKSLISEIFQRRWKRTQFLNVILSVTINKSFDLTYCSSKLNLKFRFTNLGGLKHNIYQLD